MAITVFTIIEHNHDENQVEAFERVYRKREHALTAVDRRTEDLVEDGYERSILDFHDGMSLEFTYIITAATLD